MVLMKVLDLVNDLVGFKDKFLEFIEIIDAFFENHVEFVGRKLGRVISASCSLVTMAQAQFIVLVAKVMDFISYCGHNLC